MKNRFAHFLVARSKIILIIFIILALGCAALIPFVNINYDMTEYLPADSAMRHGLDLMEAEFRDEDSSSLEVMFGDLASDAEKGQVLQRLEQLRYVDSVDYDFPEDDEDEYYNRGAYTRYILNCKYDQYSDEASAVWKEVQKIFGEGTDPAIGVHEVELGGSINDANEAGLPLWIAIAAVCMVTLILLIMASSWIEPAAFLITIGIAIMINMGTYCLFPRISNTTFGIVALLQMVLSMDYSIMLMNRYRQQRRVIPDKNEAMRRALSLSFGAITGSSLTTFAGLLALLFMSFTMGADIGLALAKGVILSLICIFTVLPALVLGFDSLMIRTAKRTPPFDLPRFSRFQFRARVPLTLLFLALFITVFIARSGVDFSYSQGRESKIDDVFGHTNTIVMIYNAKDGEAAGALADALADEDAVSKVSSQPGNSAATGDARGSAVSEDAGDSAVSAVDSLTVWQDKIRSAVTLESTLGKQRTAKKMRKFIDDMRDSQDDDEDTADMDLSTATVRLIYYDYHAGDPQFRMSIPKFVSFLKDEVLDDPDFGDSIDSDVRDRIDDMERFTDRVALTTPMTAAGLADFFDMKTSEASQLLLYHQIKSGNASGGTMTLPHFVDFLIDDVASDPDYGSMISASAKSKLKSMRSYTRKRPMTKRVNYRKAASRLGMDKAQMRMVYVSHLAKKIASGKKDPGLMTISDLAAALQEMAEDPALESQFGGEETAQLIAGLSQIGQMDPTPYDPAGMVQALTGYGIPLDGATVTLIFSYDRVASRPASHRLSVQKIIHFMLSDDSIRSSLSHKQKKQLRRLKKIIDTSVRGSRLSSSSMGRLLTMKSSDARSIYLLHQYRHGNISGWKLTPQQFVDFLVTKVLSDDSMKDRIGDNADDLKAARKLIDHVVAGRTFTYAGLADLFMDFEDSFSGSDFSAEDLSLLYELYGSKYYYDKRWTMDLMTMVTHLDEHMVSRPAFASSMEEDQIEDVHEMRGDMDEAAEKLEGEHYGRMMITASMDVDSDESRAFMRDLTAVTDSCFTEDAWFIGNTPMAWEMSQTFRGELNRITLLTALFILIIVLLTFRRLATPIVLVLMIQCAVFVTMSLLRALHIDMNYLALLIVQSIMMGATIDYAIVYSSYYVESRVFMPISEAIQAAFRGSLQTILTSAIILIVAAGLLSFAFSEPATREICRILSIGCLVATILVIFILPAVLACLDRFVVRRNPQK